jgi:uncharacterized protein YbcC (UPF0753/DUF2309 family)
MSISEADLKLKFDAHHRLSTAAHQGETPSVSGDIEDGWLGERLADAVQSVSETIAPVWPLQDYVAVNPFLGFAERPFLNARRLLRSVCDSEMLMPLSFYRQRFQAGQFGREDIEAAIAEHVTHGNDSGEVLTADDVVSQLHAADDALEEHYTTNDQRCMRTVAEFAGHEKAPDWTGIIHEEIGRHCGAHYDQGQAVWASPWRDLPLYQAWHSAAQIDRRAELLGLSGFRRLVKELPHSAEAAIALALEELQVPDDLWEPFLLCQAHSIPGWSAWARYQAQQAELRGDVGADFVDLLAIRLAYDVAVSRATGLNIEWTSVRAMWRRSERAAMTHSEHDVEIRSVLLRAAEIAYQRTLTTAIVARTAAAAGESDKDNRRSDTDLLAQVVFCIDVRSERFRRNLEQVSTRVQTFGFAGFFGVPMAWQQAGETQARPHVPALLTPEFHVQETLHDANSAEKTVFLRRRNFTRRLRKSWKQFQTSAVSCFGFVETSGIAYAWKLLRKTLNYSESASSSDGLRGTESGRLGPEAAMDCLPLTRQVELAESILRGIGVTSEFARLVVLCGHASTTQNNPLQAGLDCGACCGHSGEPNARFAAALLNQATVREELAQRGIAIPDATIFVAAVHDTTSDHVRLFDVDAARLTHAAELQQLQQSFATAGQQCVQERMPQLAAASSADVTRRTQDWSEVRPEWGLAGNAAFIVGPRTITESLDLEGRAFLHSYDHRTDKDFTTLEQIMTAPMVVAQWINSQYYASTVDQQRFGSGSKTIHNVVGNFGLFSGNGGDLTTGLPLQSVHNGNDVQHEPLRLLGVICAPRDAVAAIIKRNPSVENLVINEWMHLVVVDEGRAWRLGSDQKWTVVSDETRIDSCAATAAASGV